MHASTSRRASTPSSRRSFAHGPRRCRHRRVSLVVRPPPPRPRRRRFRPSQPGRRGIRASSPDGKPARTTPPMRTSAPHAARSRASSRRFQNRHGGPWGTPEMIAQLATGLACNEVAGDRIGAALEPMLREAAEREGFRRLPRQDRPGGHEHEGCSASGKSTLATAAEQARRPRRRRVERIRADQSRHLAQATPRLRRAGRRIQVWRCVHWRRSALIDRKLDRYIGQAGEAGEMTHLLIDRFRFDSFAPTPTRPAATC